jgi:Cu2+-exporting ATPase
LDGRELSRLVLEESVRQDAMDEVERLSDMGYSVHILSGDTHTKVDRVARFLGIPPERARGALGPEEKARVLRQLDSHDSLMVGDGLNDSLSFDEALCTATPTVDRAVLPQKCDFYFLGDGIAAVRRSLQAAFRLHRVQRDSLIFAASYNLIAVALCLAGLVSPAVAAILMPLSSVAVVTHTSSRLGRQGERWMS